MLRPLRSVLGGRLVHGVSSSRDRRRGRVERRLVAFALFCLVVVGSTTVRADRIRLRTGETLKGKLIPDASVKDRLLLFGETGKTPMALDKSQVVSVTAEPSVLDEYAARRGKGAPDALAELNLGLWCRVNGLKDLAVAHFEAAVKRDAQLDQAHEELGHVKIEGEWMTRDQARKAKGLILHKGKWLTAEEYEQKRQEEGATNEQSTWNRKFLALMRSYRAGPENRRHDVEAQLMKLEDVAAITPLLKTFGTAAEPELRTLAARALGAMKAEEAAPALVSRFLAETDQVVRESTLDELAKKEPRLVVPRLVANLKSKSVEVLNRAAWALGRLKAIDAVPKLVEALVKVEYRMVWVDQSQANPGSYENVMPAAPADGLMISGGRNIPVLTGPVVGPGAVAFGATSIPPAQLYSGMSLSLGGPTRGPVPKMESYQQRNTEVLNALKSLTGQDYGYDPAAWRTWIRKAFQPDPSPSKRIAQP